MDEPGFLFIPDISKLLKISANTLRRRSWRQKTGIPLRKVGKQLCSTRVEIDRWYKGLNG